MASKYFTEFPEQSATSPASPKGKKAQVTARKGQVVKGAKEKVTNWMKSAGQPRQVFPSLAKRVKTHAIEDY